MKGTEWRQGVNALFTTDLIELNLKPHQGNSYRSLATDRPKVSAHKAEKVHAKVHGLATRKPQWTLRHKMPRFKPLMTKLLLAEITDDRGNTGWVSCKFLREVED